MPFWLLVLIAIVPGGLVLGGLYALGYWHGKKDRTVIRVADGVELQSSNTTFKAAGVLGLSAIIGLGGGSFFVKSSDPSHAGWLCTELTPDAAYVLEQQAAASWKCEDIRLEDGGVVLREDGRPLQLCSAVPEYVAVDGGMQE